MIVRVYVRIVSLAPDPVAGCQLARESRAAHYAGHSTPRISLSRPLERANPIEPSVKRFRRLASNVPEWPQPAIR